MKIADVISEITGYSNYVSHIIDFKKSSATTVIVIIDYWRSIGNSDEVLGYCKKYVVLDYNTAQEKVYEDKATPTQLVRARNW